MPDSPRNYSPHPVLLLAAAFAIGIAAARGFDTRPAAAIVVVTAIAIACILYRATDGLILISFLALGSFCYEVERRNISADRIRMIYDSGEIASFEPVEIEGVLIGSPEPGLGGSWMRVRVRHLSYRGQGRTVTGDVRVFAAGEENTELRHGSIVRVVCRLDRDERFLNPGVLSRIEMLDQQGIDAVASVKSRLVIEKLGDAPVFIPLAWTYEQRIRLIKAFRTHFSPQTAGVMTASLLGDKHFLDRETAETFREGGTFHVLVISGLHITFIGGLTLWIVSIFTRKRVWQALLPTGFLWAYTFAVGAEIPVVRASLMFSLMLSAGLMYRQGSLLNALGICSLALLVWRPSDLFSASFQLTFVSVAAIVGCAFPIIEKLRAIGSWSPSRETPLPPSSGRRLRRFCELLYWNEAEWQIRSRRNVWSAALFKTPYFGFGSQPNVKSVVAYAFEGLLVSVIVQIWMLPLVIFYFHRVSPAAPVLNLWVGLFLALESVAAVAAVALASFNPWLAAPLIYSAEIMNALMMSLPSALSSVAIADIRPPVYSGGLRAIYLLYFGSVVVAAIRMFGWNPFAIPVQRSRRLLPFAAVTLLGTLIVLHPFSVPTADGMLKIDFLDVGQGDSALVTFPDGQTMLIDGGGRSSYSAEYAGYLEPDAPRIGESVVSEFLWEKGYSRIDYLVATHADADHMQGLVDVSRNFSIGALMLGEIGGTDADLLQLLAVARERSIPVRTLARGDSFDVGGAGVDVLNPLDQSIYVGSKNNRSVVLRVGLGLRSFLMTGDIEREAEYELGVLGGLNADVIKVPHHGSRTSSTNEFVRSVNAGLAVISVGRRSRFGHPHSEIVDRWIDSGAQILRTGDKGTITISTEGQALEVRTFKP